MLCTRHRPRQSGPVFFICSLLLVLAFIIHAHILYSTYQKQHRIEEYKTQMNEMYDTMKSMERTANSTTALLRKLQTIVKNRKTHQKNSHKLR